MTDIRTQVAHVLRSLSLSADAAAARVAEDPSNTHAAVMASTYHASAQVVRDELAEYLPAAEYVPEESK